jgi:hypothetical protein
MKEKIKQEMSLEEFTRMPMPEAWSKLQAKEGVALLRDCRTFNECHIKVREETGLWIEELVPVFRKLDASIAMFR